MDGVIYKPLIESMKWSYSRITSFENCQYEWYLKYICGEREGQNFYASYGSFVHKLHELFYKGKVSKQELPMKFLLGFTTKVEGERPSEDIVAKYIDTGYEYFKNFEPFPYNTISVEERVNFEFDGVNFVGCIDYIGDLDGEFYIVDHKSKNLRQRSGRARPTRYDEELSQYLRQLYLYGVAVEQKYGRLPDYLCFNCFKNGEFIKEKFDKGAFEDAKKWAVETVNVIKETESFKPSLDWFYCNNLCGFRDRCCYYQDLGVSQ